jgi:hypothetical protein
MPVVKPRPRLELNGHTPATAPVGKPRRVRSVPGEIRLDAIYTLAEFSKRVRLGRWGVSELQKAGLKVLEFHGRKFVEGRAFKEFLEGQAGG